MALESSREDQPIQIRCTDAFQRHRAVTLWADCGRKDAWQVVLVAPPGEAARLTSEEARVLAGQLIALAGRLDARQRGLRQRRHVPGGVVQLPVRGQATR